jgi:pilus assembly protein Flp/PilA
MAARMDSPTRLCVPARSVRRPGTGEQSMSLITRKLVAFLKKEDGPTAVEYAVMLALIIVVCIAAITTLGSNANNTFGNIALNTASS